MKSDFIAIKDLTVAYDIKPVLWDINLNIEKGTLLAIVGPNGAGKTTLIKAILNLIKPITGTISYFGKPYKDMYKKISYVPQRGSVDWDFPTTVYDVVLMGTYGALGWFKRPKNKEKKRALEALSKLGILEYKDRQISELSGGQQQRVFLARALVQDADIYFLDEPYQGVDAKTEKVIADTLKALKSAGKTIIVVHHDLKTVPLYIDSVALINKEIIAYGKIDEVFTSANIKKTYAEHNIFASVANDY